MGRSLAEIQHQWSVDMAIAEAEMEAKRQSRGPRNVDKTGEKDTGYLVPRDPEEGWRISDKLTRYEMNELGEIRSRVFSRRIRAYTSRNGTFFQLRNNADRTIRVERSIIISWFYPEGLPSEEMDEDYES